MSEEPKPLAASPASGEVVDFLRALLAGAVVLDRTDASHAAHLEAATRLIEDLQAVAGLVPELATSGLVSTEGVLVQESEGLLEKIDVLERLQHGLEGRIGAIRRRVAQTAESQGDPGWGDPTWPAFDGVVAIDVGTSNVAVAHWGAANRAPEVGPIEPAAVNVLDAAGFRTLVPGSYLSGEAALAHRSGVNLYRSVRRLLGAQAMARPAATGKAMVQVAVRTLVGAMITSLLSDLARRLGHERLRFPRVVVTVPASGDLALEIELRTVLEAMRLPVNVELDEATAACIHHLLRPLLLQEFLQVKADGTTTTPGAWYAEHLGLEVATDPEKPKVVAFDAHVLCIDLGGGSTDLALLELSLQQDAGGCQVQVEVQGTTGFPDLSGEGLTLHLFMLLKRRLALALCHPRRALLGRGATGDAAPVGPHPWYAWHRLEAGPSDLSLESRLADDVKLLHARWDEVASGKPLSDALKAAVDRMVPTVWKGAPAAGRRLRAANARALWQEAERLKRLLAAERQALLGKDRDDDDPLPTVRAALDPAAFPRDPSGCDLAARLALGREDEGLPREPDALCVTTRDVDAWVEAKGAALLEDAVLKLTDGTKVQRVILAGGGTHSARLVVERVVRQALGLGSEQVVFDPDEAKTGVAKGACLWAVGNALEGVEVLLSRRPRCPATLWLLGAVQNEVLFREGDPIERFAYVQPPHREGAEADKIVLIGREQGGRLEPYLMFDPSKGAPVRAIGDLPIAQRKGVVVKNVDRFLGFTQKGHRFEFHCADPAKYVQQDETMVPQWELFDLLKKAMTMEEVIAWIEGSTHLQVEPPAEHAFHRYYLDDTRRLWLVYHARGKKLLCPAQVMRQLRHHVPDELDPFSGVH